MRPYDPTKRIHDPAYLIANADMLKRFALEHNSSSPLLYACLDLRTALELIELIILLASIEERLRPEIIELAETKNGIDKANKKIKSLKEKFQLYYQAVCEVVNIPGKYFDFKKSSDLQFRLSKYLHTYIRHPADINFESEFMQASLSLIDESINFIQDYLIIDSEKFQIQIIDINQMPKEDRVILDEWKQSTKMTYEELKDKLNANFRKRQV